MINENNLVKKKILNSIFKFLIITGIVLAIIIPLILFFIIENYNLMIVFIIFEILFFILFTLALIIELNILGKIGDKL